MPRQSEVGTKTADPAEVLEATFASLHAEQEEKSARIDDPEHSLFEGSKRKSHMSSTF